MTTKEFLPLAIERIPYHHRGMMPFRYCAADTTSYQTYQVIDGVVSKIGVYREAAYVPLSPGNYAYSFFRSYSTWCGVHIFDGSSVDRDGYLVVWEAPSATTRSQLAKWHKEHPAAIRYNLYETAYTVEKLSSPLPIWATWGVEAKGVSKRSTTHSVRVKPMTFCRLEEADFQGLLPTSVVKSLDVLSQAILGADYRSV